MPDKAGKILAKVGPVYAEGKHGPYIAVFAMHDFEDEEFSFKKGDSFSIHLADNNGNLISSIWRDGLFAYYLENLESLRGTELVIGEYACKDRKEQSACKEKWRANYARIATGTDKEYFYEKYGVIS